MGTRIARSPIEIPDGVELKLEGRVVIVKGKLGELRQEVHGKVKIHQENSSLQFSPAHGDRESNALTGTMTSLVKNMVKGVSKGFECCLTLVGVGYRAKVEGKNLNLSLGLSHPVVVTMRDGITVESSSPTEIVLKGIDKQKVFQMGANIRAKRPPEPYKGKGIRYKDESIAMKETKKK